MIAVSEKLNESQLICDEKDTAFWCLKDINVLDEASLPGLGCFTDNCKCKVGLHGHSMQAVRG